ncbi:MAG: COX15/CtaA family protein [Rhodospirillales bacterium]
MSAAISRSRTLAPDTSQRAVAIWLLACCAMVFVMVVLGGVTRLTESGLSIVSWQPVTGALPPLSQHDWQVQFDAYKATPEFAKRNFWMDVGDFKTIFWMEYLHRLWGRLIGLAFAAPFAWFVLRGHIRGPLAWKLAGILALGAAQGAMGWYMVASGLVDRPDVSHYRLAAHLLLAFAIHAAMFRVALGLLDGPPRHGAGAPLAGHGRLVLWWSLVVILWGAFVAGLDAGKIYNTFPLMGGEVVPAVAFSMTPWPLDLVENAATVQFVHRWLAIALVAIVLALWARARRFAVPPRLRLAADLLAAMALLQAAIGVATLLTEVWIPLAALHQAGAFALFTLALWFGHLRQRVA